MVYGSLSPTSTKVLQASLLLSLTGNFFFFISYFCVDSSYLSHSTESHSSGTAVSSRQIVFVGGVPRSGTTLCRSMLDAHPDIHCGEETRVIPQVLAAKRRWTESTGHDEDKLYKAIGSFLYDIISGHGTPAKFLCNKDPLILGDMPSLMKMFPNSKFVLMIRDGRAVAYSIVSRKVGIGGVNISSYLDSAMFWNKMMTVMVGNCTKLGEEHCIMVPYDKLVQDPKTWMEKILAFGGIPWHENVLHHHELINKEVQISK